MSQTEQNKFFNAPNILLKDFFSKDEIETISNSITEETGNQHVSKIGYWAYHIDLPHYIIERVTKVASELMNEEMILEEYQVALYKNFNLHEAYSFPILCPHTDENFKEPRFSIDALLDTNISWPVEVYSNGGVTSLLADVGDALTFSGTHQYHWRPKKDFAENEFIKLIFMHFKPKNANPITDDEFKYIKSLEQTLMNNWLASPGRSFNR